MAMVDEYIPGQRWLSNAEVELGLGMILETNARSVTVQFPATAETRIYARRSAPLCRVRLNIGEAAEDQQGQVLTVVAVDQQEGLLVYRVLGPDGIEQMLPEPALNDRLRVNRPQDKLLAGRIDQDGWFDLRHQAWQQLADSARSPVFGLVGPRVSLIPHQLYIAAEIAGRIDPRVLLADEVGLGKTIEAGLIIHKLLLAERARRVLVVVPSSLQHQWLVEMLRRFNLGFSLFDQDRFDAQQDETDNPFHTEQRVLCSLELLTSSPAVARAALAGEWDLLVVDEAHHLSWSEQQSSLDYDLVAALAAETRGLLLLSATPEQFGRAGHFARLRLLDPDRFHDYSAFLDEEAQYEPVARLAARLLDGDRLDEQQQDLLSAWLNPNQNGHQDQDWRELSNETLVDRLVDRHGTGRVMFRNTRAAVGGFPSRQVLPTALPMPAEHQQPLADLAQGWTDADPRIRWLIDTLNTLNPDKLLLITEQASTVLALRDALQAREGIPAAVFHEGMSIVERDRAAAWFAERDGGAQVLLCSEIGSEGRNFQFAHHLVLFDLPPSPELLEQRIGRLDRIGQTDTIQLHLPYLQGSRDETLFHWYHQGLNAIAQNNPAAGAVHTALAEALQQVIAGERELPPLLEQARQQSQELSAALEAGRDRLLELHSHRPQQATTLIDAIQTSRDQRGPSLRDYMDRYWDAFGIDYEPGPDGSIVLHPTQHMLETHFPGLPEDGTTVTFSRSGALSHEDWQFLTREHPMVRGAMEMLTSDERGAAALTLISHPAVRPGSILLELFYIVESSAPGELQAGRFLPPTPLRLLIDQHGRERSDDLGALNLSGECLSRRKKLAHQILDTLNAKLRPLFSSADQLAQKAAEPLITTAVETMRQTLDDEWQRLRQLARSNPNVRQQELDQLAAQRRALDEHLTDSRVRLDAARLIVAQ